MSMPEEIKKENLIPNMSQTIGKLAAALSKAQGQMKPAPKDAENPYYKSRYADLASVWEAIREPLSKNDLAVIQTTEGEGEAMVLITTLMHSSGEWIRGLLKLTPVEKTDKEGRRLKPDPQSVGSAISYARRYALSAILGVAADDDDGNAASGKDQKPDGHTMAPNSKSGTSQARPSAPPPQAPAQNKAPVNKSVPVQPFKLIEGGLTEADVMKVMEASKVSGVSREEIMEEVKNVYKKTSFLSLTPQEGATLVNWINSKKKVAS